VGAESVTCDLQADAGVQVRFNFVDAAGLSLAGVKVGTRTEPSKSDTFEINGFTSGETRVMTFFQPDRNLGRIQRVKVGDRPTQTVTVKLEPCTTITGCLVTAGRDPISNVPLLAWVLPREDFTPWLRCGTTDAAGRFHFTVSAQCDRPLGRQHRCGCSGRRSWRSAAPASGSRPWHAALWFSGGSRRGDEPMLGSYHGGGWSDCEVASPDREGITRST